MCVSVSVIVSVSECVNTCDWLEHLCVWLTMMMAKEYTSEAFEFLAPLKSSGAIQYGVPHTPTWFFCDSPKSDTFKPQCAKHKEQEAEST